MPSCIGIHTGADVSCADHGAANTSSNIDLICLIVSCYRVSPGHRPPLGAVMLPQEQAKEAYDKDQQRLGQKVYDRAVLPVSFDDITTQWLTGTLCRDYPGAEVVD